MDMNCQAYAMEIVRINHKVHGNWVHTIAQKYHVEMSLQDQSRVELGFWPKGGVTS
jgi:hypothetical protein